MLIIVYDPERGRACPDGHIDCLADGIVSNAVEFGSNRIVTSTGAVIDAIVRRALLGYIEFGDMELHHIDRGYTEVYHLDEWARWMTTDGVEFGAEYPRSPGFIQLHIDHLVRVMEEKRIA